MNLFKLLYLRACICTYCLYLLYFMGEKTLYDLELYGSLHYLGRYLLAPKTLSSMCTFNEWVWVTTYFILTYFWDERNDIHVDPKAPFPPYTKTLPADMAHSSADTRISLCTQNYRPELRPSTKLAANNIQTNVTNIMITRNTAKR